MSNLEQVRPVLSPTVGVGLSLPPLPFYIKLPRGAVTWAEKCNDPHGADHSRKSGAQKAGLRYQRQVRDWLTLARPGGTLDCGPWYRFSDSDSRRKYCQPDFLIIFPQRVVVVEAKIRWTTDAWWQLRRLYLPVLASALPGRELVPLTICRSYDPAIRIPEEIKILDQLADASIQQFNVMVWKP